MSHYSVLMILGPDVAPDDLAAVNARIDSLLAPFDEGKDVPHREIMSPDDLQTFLEFYREKGLPEQLSHEHLAYVEDWNNGTDAVIVGADAPPASIAYTSTYNPASKWDWWTLGGRWRGLLRVRQGAAVGVDEHWRAFPVLYGEEPSEPGTADVARVGDVDWEGMRTAAEALARIDWAEAEAVSGPDRYWRYGIEGEDTLDTYVARRTGGMTFAACNGEWMERGQMGWFGVSRNEMPSEDWDAAWWRMVTSLPADTTVAVVDCHI